MRLMLFFALLATAHAQAPTVTATLAPASGTLTNQPVVQVSGSAGGAAPLTVTFLVDGTIESQITNLAAGEQFRHGISLVGDGAKRFTVRVRDTAGATANQDLGSVTFDTTGPAAPVLLNAVPIVSNQNQIQLKGIHPEPPRPGQTQQPKVLVLGPPGVRFTPTQPQPVTDANGQFETIADVTNLPDGSYQFRLIAIDAAGNFSSSSTLQFKR